MEKITTIRAVAKFSKEQRERGKTVGLIVGSFDIVHMGHVNLFRFAKKQVDYLIVGLDNDQTIKIVKGENRPINNFKNRSELLSDFETIDKIFEINHTNHHDSEAAYSTYGELLNLIRPTHIFSHKDCDKHWKKKKKMAGERMIVFVLDRSRKVTNSGTIIQKILSEL